jgi:predicted nucleic-acid-binding Zn-ribbon protein
MKTTCPCCKYQPIYKKDGSAAKRTTDFKEVSIGFISEDFGSRQDFFISYQCPKCGVLFRRLED